jgi:hypothetical protein
MLLQPDVASSPCILLYRTIFIVVFTLVSCSLLNLIELTVLKTCDYTTKHWRIALCVSVAASCEAARFTNAKGAVSWQDHWCMFNWKGSAVAWSNRCCCSYAGETVIIVYATAEALTEQRTQWWRYLIVVIYLGFRAGVFLFTQARLSGLETIWTVQCKAIYTFFCKTLR